MTRCDSVQEALSAQLDGAAPADGVGSLVEGHLEHCQDCQDFAAGAESIRRQLRVHPVGEVPDVAGSVRARLEGERRRRRGSVAFAAAAAFVIGMVVTASLLGTGSSGTPLAGASIPERVALAQEQVETLQATLTIREFGWHPDVPERAFSGSISYEAPERLAVDLVDDTTYPTDQWRANDLDIVIAGDRSWSRGLRACPVQALPACTPDAPRLHEVIDREPFDPSLTVPLDLVVPVRSFQSAAPPTVVDQGDVDGRSAVAVEVTAAQAAPLLDAFSTTGNLREIHASDRVELWLDTEALVPLRVTVHAGESDVRSRWAVSRGYRDAPGAAILRIEWTDVELDAGLAPDAFRQPLSPGDWHTVDGGFDDDAPAAFVPVPGRLPGQLTVHRDGVIRTASGDIGVRTWSDGRSWVKVRATTSWSRNQLFGGLGPGIRPVALPRGSGTGYLDAANNLVAVHGDGIDLIVTGSLDLETLLEITSALGVAGQRVPADWTEATAADRAGAVAAFERLELPVGVDGFAEPAFRVEEGFVTAIYAGPGARSFVLTQGPGERLAPPLDNDVVEVSVDGTAGRWSPSRGELEWTAAGTLRSLRSSTVGLQELLEIAASLGPA